VLVALLHHKNKRLTNLIFSLEYLKYDPRILGNPEFGTINTLHVPERFYMKNSFSKNNSTMDENSVTSRKMTDENSVTSRKMTGELPYLNQTEKENDFAPPIRSSLPPVLSLSSSSSPPRKSNAALLPFQPIDVAVVTAATTRTVGTPNQCSSNNNNRNVVSPTLSSLWNTTTTTPMTKSSPIMINTDDDNDTTSCTDASNKFSPSSIAECFDASSLRSTSPVSSTTFPSTTTKSSSTSLCDDVDMPSPLSLKFSTLSRTDLHQPITTTPTTDNGTTAFTSIESILQHYPKELSVASKITKLNQLALSLAKSGSNEGDKNMLETSVAATEIVQIVMTDVIRLHRMLVRAEHRITELQNGHPPCLCPDREPSEECNFKASMCKNNDGSSDVKMNGISIDGDANADVRQGTFDTNNTNDTATLLQARIASLEKELQSSQTMIQQLKNQKQHVVANTKKKKVLLDDMERRLSTTENELQTVLSERNQLRVSLQEMTEMRDSYKQKLRNQQEMVKDSKNFMMEYKNKLQKTQHMRALENELLDNFRKLAIHTG
jgi:hypothetical protein